MKIIYEQDGCIDYFDVILTERELKDILLYKGLEEKIHARKRPVSIYIRRGEHAAKDGDESEGD